MLGSCSTTIIPPLPNPHPVPNRQNKESFEFFATEHFRMSGVYWGLTALYLLGRPDALDGAAVVDWVLSCQAPCGGFGGSERHDPHLLYTLSALQILALYDRLDAVNADAVAACARRHRALLETAGSAAGASQPRWHPWLRCAVACSRWCATIPAHLPPNYSCRRSEAATA